MRFFIVLTLLTAGLSISLALTARAADGQVVSCGVPENADGIVRTDPGLDVCDFYSRQLAYREESIKLRRQLTERAENFAVPRRIAVENYKANLKALHDSIED